MNARGLGPPHGRGQVAFAIGLEPLLAQVTNQPRLLRFVPANWIQSVNALPGGREWLISADTYVRACGCNESAVAALLSTPVGVAIAYMSSESTGVALVLPLLAFAVAAFVVGALAGKLVGLALARRRYRRATGRWLRALTSQDRQGESYHV